MSIETFETIRPLITATLEGVPGMGRVFDHLRVITELEQFLEMYTVPSPIDPSRKVPCVAWLERVAEAETHTWNDGLDVANVIQLSSWRITLLHGLHDSEDAEAASDTWFHRLADGVLSAFRFNPTLGDTSGVILRAWCDGAPSLGVFTQEATGYTCHKGEFVVRVEVQITE